MSFYKGYKSYALLITLILLFGMGKQSTAQTPGTNYVRTRLPQVAMADTSKLDTVPAQRQLVNIQYSDALGRALQAILVQGSPNQMDMILPYVYDNMGRRAISYLPYADEGTSASTSGTLRSNAVNNVLNFYNPSTPGATKIPTDAAPYSQTVYEASPLGRVMQQGNVGSVFQPGTGHTVSSSYQVNTSQDNILYYVLTGGLPTIVSGYNPGVLTKTIMTDGNGHRIAVWKDLQGKMVTKSQLDAPTPYFSNDYVYDDLDQLINIVPPAEKKELANVSAPPLPTVFAQQSYMFHYDSLGRLVEKKVPGKGWEYIIYNHGDKPVLVQDSNMRAKNQWLFVKYDGEGRAVQTGLYTNTSITARKALQYYCDNNFSNLWETWQPGTGYTDNAFPQQNAVPSASPLCMFVTYYYDDYTFPGASAKPFQTNVFSTSLTLRAMGKATGMSVYVLGTTSQYLTTVNYYDNQDRMIQQISDNHLGNIDVVNCQYNFLGQLTGSQRITTAIAGSPVTVQDRYVYDQSDRLLATYESLNGSAAIDISHNAYNEIGQEVSKALNSTNSDVSFAQTQVFTYSIRGELTGINNGTLTNDGVTQTDPNALFGESITYSESSPVGAAPQYNGNISCITWRNKIEATGISGVKTGGQGYALVYDSADRLTQSNYYTQPGTTATFTPSTTGALDETIKGYDEMGNIDTLQRTDINGSALNKLTYHYQNLGNQLDSISDAGSQNITGTFTYDGNGNMTSDSRKGITITYNYLNLPDTVKQGANRLVFTYDAAGNKLYKQLITGGSVVSQRHYIGDEELTASSSIAYDGQVAQIAMAEGRIVNTGGGSYQYEYILKDHLGNNRLAFRPNTDGSLTVTTVQNYYPFGGDMGDATMNYSVSPPNNYKYNGKEIQPELNLNTYDFGARHYDPVLARWEAVDPLAESSDWLSPYNYVENNPLNMVDPNGMAVVDPRVVDPGDPDVVSNTANVSSGLSATVSGAATGVTWVATALTDYFKATGEFNMETLKVTQQNWKGLYGAQQNQPQVYSPGGGANQGGDPYPRGAIGGPVPYYGNFVGPGPDGPKANPYQLLGYNGKILKPIDMVDAAAQRHDYAYWMLKASGVNAALWDDRTGYADRALASSAQSIVEMYAKGINDSITHSPISLSEYQEAQKIEISFGFLGGLKYIGNLLGR